MKLMKKIRWWLFRRLSELGWWICPEPHKSVLAAGMVEAVTSAGFRILGPDDLDEKTVEKCAAELEKPRKFIDGTEVALPSALACAAALRALKEKQG